MTCNITSTPLIDPLPVYTRDPETSSIHSAAPSYISEVPPYEPPSTERTNVQSSPTPQRPLRSRASHAGLPSLRYAEGFQNRAHGSISDVESHNFNVSNWSSVQSSHASRQYQNVAARRAVNAGVNAGITMASALTQMMGPVSPTSSASPSTNSNASPSSSSSSRPAYEPSDADIRYTSSANPTAAGPVSANREPLNPLEDPDLVGEAAAKKARNARIYREQVLRGEDAVRHESKTWDFMLAQMADWEERERSWNNFRREVGMGRRPLLGRRLGLRV